ncbi:hypothetical protein H0H93_015085 [Arthromyces matolae]|nr:hypothetical protein H0H93_015085 [Arthromyces matolae]
MSIHRSQYTHQYGAPPQTYGRPNQGPIHQTGYSGYGNHSQYQSQQYGPPPGADPQLWQWFSAVDVDRSGSISVTELQTALVNGESTCLSIIVVPANSDGP